MKDDDLAEVRDYDEVEPDKVVAVNDGGGVGDDDLGLGIAAATNGVAHTHAEPEGPTTKMKDEYDVDVEYEDDKDDDMFQEPAKDGTKDDTLYTTDSNGKVHVPSVSWFRQLWVSLWYKNIPLIARKPIHLLLLLVSGLASVLTSWPAARDYTASDDGVVYPTEFTECGTIPIDYFELDNPNRYNYSDYQRWNDLDSKVQISLNEQWRRGWPVLCLCLGPMVSAICAYLIVHEEIQLHMLGVLRGLGLRDSVYWISWYIPFAMLALVNSLLAAVTAKCLPVHVYETTYFGGILGAFFFLHLALLGASFFLAAVSGTARRGSVWLILLMMIPMFMPIIVMNNGFYGFSARSLVEGGDAWGLGTHHGLFWINRMTERAMLDYSYNDDAIYGSSGPTIVYNDDVVFNDSNSTNNATTTSATSLWNDTSNRVTDSSSWTDDAFLFENGTYPPGSTIPPRYWSNDFTVPNVSMCNTPLLSKQEGYRFKTEEERNQVSPADMFVGCYASPGFAAGAWTPRLDYPAFIGPALWWFIPYFHFYTIWGNICGLTGNRNREFGWEHASMNAAQLAREGLAMPPAESIGLGTSLAPQASMLRPFTPGRYACKYEFDFELGYEVCKNPKWNCPAYNAQYELCSEDYSLEHCQVAQVINGVSINFVFCMLLALSVVYVLLAAYWGIVLVGGAGSYPFYFFIMPSYWLGVSSKKSSTSSQPHDINDAEVGAGTASGRNDGSGAIQLHNVSKSYGSVQALKPVSFEMARGEVTALLGHNGAGKTTLSKLLTCEFGATSGDITVFGHSVKDDPFAVRRLVGNCKQDDYLWPNLSAKEHLDIVGGLRGVDPDEHEEIVQKWLESVDLDGVQHQSSSAFSGGMKRRLSLALSTIGARLLIVLDEPTTGMDPVNRRYVWKHIDEIKKGRVVLLTTHAMEEADLLADMVAIMRKGELAAWGSPLQLKAEHGSALQFTALVKKEKVESTKAEINARFADSKSWVAVDAGDAGNITVTIQKIQQGDNKQGVSVDLLTKFVAWLENPADSGVMEYGFSNSSLEEVFLKVTEGDIEVPVAPLVPEGQVLIVSTDALPGTVVAGQATRVSTDALPGAVVASDATPCTSNGRVALEEYIPNLSVPGQIKALIWFNFVRTWTGKRAMVSWIMYGLLLAASTVIILWLGSLQAPILVVPIICVSFILPNICSGIYGDRSEGLFYLMQANGLLKTSYLVATGLYALIIALLYSFLQLTLLYLTPMFREPEECVPDYSNNIYCDSFQGFAAKRVINVDELTYSPYSSILSIEVNNTESGVVDYINIGAYSSPSGYGMILGAIFFFSLTFPGAALSSSYLPGHKFALIVVACFVLAAGATPAIMYAVSLLRNASDYYYYDYGYEEQPHETCTNKIVLNTTCANITDSDEFGVDFLNCAGIRASDLVPLCFPSHVALLPQFALFQMLSLALSANIKFVSNRPGYVEETFIPKIKGGYCSGSTCSFPAIQGMYWRLAGYELLSAIILILVGVTVALVVAFPNAQIQHFKNVAHHCFEQVRDALCCRNRAKSTQQATTTDKDKEELDEVVRERQVVHSMIEPLLQKHVTELVDVVRVDDEAGPRIADHASLPRDELPPILMHKLTKVYPAIGRLPPKVALKSMDLHVAKGQVLGFLGKNGAGKTTALKILAGAHEATSGIGLVSGYDVSCERIAVFERLGNCPQFDVIWPKVTVKEHLVFFAKMKGLPRDKVQEACQSIASAVGLGAVEVYNRNAGALSGGMRRRLSIAISLLGAPSCLVLDEPTTGLDPSTRNNIWDLINSFSTDERATVITTHMMLEADTLCNNIAIVSKGELVVVATQQRLKDKFGSGYLLQLNLVKSTPANQKLAMHFVRNHLHKGATLGTKHAKTLHISLPRDLDLKQAFAALYNPAIRPECINQFLMSQSSLEDVFLALGE